MRDDGCYHECMLVPGTTSLNNNIFIVMKPRITEKTKQNKKKRRTKNECVRTSSRSNESSVFVVSHYARRWCRREREREVGTHLPPPPPPPLVSGWFWVIATNSNYCPRRRFGAQRKKPTGTRSILDRNWYPQQKQNTVLLPVRTMIAYSLWLRRYGTHTTASKPRASKQAIRIETERERRSERS